MRTSSNKVHIAIAHEDREDVVQYANGVEQAKYLIKEILPRLKTGYRYIII